MKRKSWIIGAAIVVAGTGWYVFRPERLVVNQRVSEGFPVASASSSATPEPVASGRFHAAAHETSGIATIYRFADGRRTLRLTDFSTSNGPEVQVYLGAATDARDNDTVTRAGFVTLGAMKGNVGEQNYEIPAGVDLAKYHSVTIWCHRFGVNFGTAPLAPAGTAAAARRSSDGRPRI